MDCAGVRNDLSAFLDRELAEDGRSEIEGHLRVCASCAREFEELRKLIVVVAALPRVRVPSRLSESIAGQIAAVGAGSSPARRRARWLKPARALAAIAAALVVVCLFPGRRNAAREEARSPRPAESLALLESERRRSNDASGRREAKNDPEDRIENEKGEGRVARTKDAPSRAGDVTHEAGPEPPGASAPAGRTLQRLVDDLDALHASFAIESPAPDRPRIRITVAQADAERLLEALSSRGANRDKATAFRSRIERREPAELRGSRASGASEGVAGGGTREKKLGAPKPGDDRDGGEAAADRKAHSPGFAGAAGGKDEFGAAEETIEIVIEPSADGD